MPYNNNTDGQGLSSRLHFSLIFITPVVLSLLTPAVRDTVASFFSKITITPAYSGDGILIGDSGNNIPFSRINWTITQQPMFQDSFQAVSLYAVPLKVARKFIYPYHSKFSSRHPFRVRKEDIHSIGSRIYVYHLSKTYLNHGQEPKVNINVEVLAEFHSMKLPAPLFRFERREAFSNFVDMEPGAHKAAAGCSCMLGEAIEEYCNEGDQNCIEKLKVDTGCKFCSPDGINIPHASSYNFYSTMVPENSTVRYDAELLMYFYNTSKTAFEEYYICTIRGTDTCSFQTSGSFKMSPLWRNRMIIIAYTHPIALPSSSTTHLIIKAETVLNESLLLFVICVLIIYLIIRHCFHFLFFWKHRHID